MNNFTFIISYNDSRASFDGRILIHEINEEHFLERVSWKFSNCINLSYKIFELELISCEPVDTIEESLGERKKVKIKHELFERLSKIFNDWTPSYLGSVFKIDLVNFGSVCNYWIKVRMQIR